jgi:hypothetical protein
VSTTSPHCCKIARTYQDLDSGLASKSRFRSNDELYTKGLQRFHNIFHQLSGFLAWEIFSGKDASLDYLPIHPASLAGLQPYLGTFLQSSVAYDKVEELSTNQSLTEQCLSYKYRSSCNMASLTFRSRN